jgi:hypothetical protein
MSVLRLSKVSPRPVAVVVVRPATRVAKAVPVAVRRVAPALTDSRGSRKKIAGVNDAAAVEKEVS